MGKIYLLAFAFLLSVQSGIAQIKLYEDTFSGGVVTGGYSNGATVPSGSGSFNVSIPAGSTIRRAYLIAGRVGNAPNVTVTLNGAPFTFSSSNVVSTGWTTLYGGVSGVHAIDITSSISPATSAYTIAVPVQSTVSDKYPEFYLYIAFNNSSLPAVTSAIFVNTLTASSSMPWILSTATPISTASPVGLGILGGYATTGSDCETVIVNGTNVGSFGGPDFNSSSVWGSMAGFQYYNLTLTGYNDDNANQAISLPDALSNIQALITSGTTSVPVTFNHCGGGTDNHVWAVFLTHSGGTILDQGLGPVKAVPEAGKVHVSWETQTLIGNEELFVERSADLTAFEVVGKTAAMAGPHAYQLKDVSPDFNKTWYRIRSVDPDGKSSVSEAVRVSFDEAPGFVFFPQPAAAGSDVQFVMNCEPTGMTYRILAASSGSLLREGKLTGGSLPTQGLAPGAYLVEMIGCGERMIAKLLLQ